MKFLNNKYVTIPLLLVLVWFGLSAVHISQQEAALSQQDKDIQNRLQTVQKQNQELQRSNAFSRTVSYLEQQARIKLNYKAEGEEVAIVQQASVSIQAKLVKEDALMVKIKNWLYNIVH